MSLRHIRVPPGVRPAIIFLGLIAGFGASDVWSFVIALLAAWFVDAQPWDPFQEGKIRERKSNEAPE
jgi:hypothetical protein